MSRHGLAFWGLRPKIGVTAGYDNLVSRHGLACLRSRPEFGVATWPGVARCRDRTGMCARQRTPSARQSAAIAQHAPTIWAAVHDPTQQRPTQRSNAKCTRPICAVHCLGTLFTNTVHGQCSFKKKKKKPMGIGASHTHTHTYIYILFENLEQHYGLGMILDSRVNIKYHQS